MVEIGQELPALQCGPITRTTLALFAGASGDPNPIHIDSDFARAAGLEDVFAHGMLSVGYLGRLLTRWAPQERLRSWSVRFLAITPVNAQLTLTGRVEEVFEQRGERVARLKLAVTTQSGVQTIAGEAFIQL
jgi:acyl dehydratase